MRLVGIPDATLADFFRRPVSPDPPMPGRKSTRVVFQSEFPDVTDVESWTKMIDWLVEAQSRLREALDSVGGVRKS